MKTMTLKQFTMKIAEQGGLKKADENCKEVCKKTTYLVKRKDEKSFTGGNVSCNMLQVNALVSRGLFREVTAGIHYQRNNDWKRQLHIISENNGLEQLRKAA